MSMTIAQLLNSTERLKDKGYGVGNTFSNKEFGEIYAYNKTVRVKPKHSIIEITMMIKAVTEKVTLKSGQSRTAAAHKIMVAISNVEQEEVTADELVKRARDIHPGYQNKKRYPDIDIIQKAIDPDKEVFPGKTVMEQNNGTYVLITNNISDKSEIRVWCSCSSYYWVFQYYNIEAEVNIPGKQSRMSPYKHKTKKGLDEFKKGKPMRNPKKAPGVCKHIRLLLAMLMDKRTIANNSTNAKKNLSEYHFNMSKFKKIQRLNEAEYKKLTRQYDADRSRKVQERDRNSSIQGYF